MTKQIQDGITVNGELKGLRRQPVIEASKFILEIEEDKIEFDLVNSTACHRKYVAFWLINEDKLYLEKVIGKYKLACDRPVLADWFTGIVTFESGETDKHTLVTSYYIDKGVITDEVTDRELLSNKFSIETKGNGPSVNKRMLSTIAGLAVGAAMVAALSIAGSTSEEVSNNEWIVTREFGSFSDKLIRSKLESNHFAGVDLSISCLNGKPTTELKLSSRINDDDVSAIVYRGDKGAVHVESIEIDENHARMVAPSNLIEVLKDSRKVKIAAITMNEKESMKYSEDKVWNLWGNGFKERYEQISSDCAVLNNQDYKRLK